MVAAGQSRRAAGGRGPSARDQGNGVWRRDNGGRAGPRNPNAPPSLPAALGGVAAADPGVGAGPGPGVGLATAAPSLGPVPGQDRDQPPSPDRREGPSRSPRLSPDLARGPGPGLGPGVLRPCPRGNPSPGRDPRVLPSLPKRKERCPLKQMVMSAGLRDSRPEFRNGVWSSCFDPINIKVTPHVRSAALS